jgi:hypothetical protein
VQGGGVWLFTPAAIDAYAAKLAGGAGLRLTVGGMSATAATPAAILRRLRMASLALAAVEDAGDPEAVAPYLGDCAAAVDCLRIMAEIEGTEADLELVHVALMDDWQPGFSGNLEAAAYGGADALAVARELILSIAASPQICARVYEDEEVARAVDELAEQVHQLRQAAQSQNPRSAGHTARA